MNRRHAVLVAATLAGALGAAALYRWSEAEVAPAAPPVVITTLGKYVLYDSQNPAHPSFRFAIGVAVSGMDADDLVEAEFENPVDARQTLPGSVMDKPGVPKDQFMLVSPGLDAVQCRVYDVTVTLYRARGHEPVAVRREKILSTLDSAAIAAGGGDAIERARKGEAVCGG